MLILGIETSGPGGGIALLRDDECLAEATLESEGKRHAQTLVSQIDELFRELGLHVAQLDALAVSIGPGSFTGLRIGVMCAKTLAYATGSRLAAVDTLEAIAHNSPWDVSAVHVISDAQRGDVFVGTYRRVSDNDWRREAPITIENAVQWLAARHAGEVISGPALALHCALVPAQCRPLPESSWQPTARAIALIGRRQVERGQLADCARLEPFYLRRSAAEERADPIDPAS